MYKKIVLAYSGGLDTTVIIPWLKEQGAEEVIAVCGDVGQDCDWKGLEKKALATGASKLVVLDLKKEFVEDYLWPLVKAGGPYEKKYLLGTSAARPLLAKALAEVAIREKADAYAHGCTGKGNDQVRFEIGVKAFAPELPVVAPWRTWDLRSRDDEIAYLEAHGIPLPAKKSDSYSRDDNLWHVSHEGLDLEDPCNEPKLKGMLKLCVPPAEAPAQPEYVVIGFERGLPIAIDGKAYGPVELVHELNVLGGKHGVGILDLVENRVVGMKSRGVYETPGGTLIMAAHDKLEELCLDRDLISWKTHNAQRFAELIYEGQWFTPLCEALKAFFDSTQSVVSGSVRLKLWKGSITAAGVASPESLYSASLASFTTGPLYSHADSAGFINLHGLPTKVRARLKAAAKAAGVDQEALAHKAALDGSWPPAWLEEPGSGASGD